MSDIRDFFIKSLDEAESGINAMMNKLMSKLGGLDPEVKEVLDQQGIRPQYFSFRYEIRFKQKLSLTNNKNLFKSYPL